MNPFSRWRCHATLVVMLTLSPSLGSAGSPPLADLEFPATVTMRMAGIETAEFQTVNGTWARTSIVDPNEMLKSVQYAEPCAYGPYWDGYRWVCRTAPVYREPNQRYYWPRYGYGTYRSGGYWEFHRDCEEGPC